MSVVRRLYLYGVAFASLVMLAIGLNGLGDTLVDALVPGGLGTIGGLPSDARSRVAQYAGLVLVGLPVWLLHWILAQRSARADVDERASGLRRLFVYAVLVTFGVRWAFSAIDLLTELGRVLLGAIVPTGAGLRDVLSPLPWLAVSGALWGYHREVAIADRGEVGEAGSSDTLRRWYRYGLALFGLLLLLSEAAATLYLTWEGLVGAAREAVVSGAESDALAVSSAAAGALVGLALWLAHWSGWALRADEDVARNDRRSVLRPVYLFLALGIAVGVALSAAARMLYYALARALGESEPGGAGGPLLLILAGPVSTLAVYGTGWLYHRTALTAQARAQAELPQQTGVRRLYAYLVALIALAFFATGVGGLLWTLADGLTSAERTLNRPDWWREQVSLYATLIVVGLPVWLAHWAPLAGPRGVRWVADEPRSLARRLYLYLTLLGGVLALLGSGAVAARQVLDLILGGAPTGGALTNLARAAAVAIVSGVVVLYHQRILRADVARAGAAAPPAPVRPFGVVTHSTAIGALRQPARVAEWFVSREAARAAYERYRAESDGAAWVALVRVEEQSGEGPLAPAESEKSTESTGSGEGNSPR